MGVENLVLSSLLRLDSFVVKEQFKGYDPYDVLASPLPLKILGTKLCYYLTQLNKRDPYKILRTGLAVPKQYVPKGLALFIESYSIWDKAGLGSKKEELQFLKRELDALRAPGYGDKFCWGLNYQYATSLKYVPSLFPSLVVTAYVHRAYHSFMKHHEEFDFKDQLESSVRFLLEDLERTYEPEGLCFSYYTVKKDIVYNANAKGGEMLARMYSMTQNQEYLDLATSVMDHTVGHQKEDGRWNYRKLEDGSERKQIDFHQLYMVECLDKFVRFSGNTDEKFLKSIDLGIDFYLNNQLKDEQLCYYRWPKYWPIDIHNQASGIIALTRLSDRRPELFEIAKKMAHYTIENMQLPSGGFMYQKHKNYTNKTSYIRWANAWMHLALTTVIDKLRSENT